MSFERIQELEVDSTEGKSFPCSDRQPHPVHMCEMGSVSVVERSDVYRWYHVESLTETVEEVYSSMQRVVCGSCPFDFLKETS